MTFLVCVSGVQIAYVALSVVVVALVIAFGVGRWSSYVPPSDKENEKS